MKTVTYFQGVFAELRKVQWPTFATVSRHFLSVVIGVGVATAVIAAMDFVFIRGLALLINSFA